MKKYLFSLFLVSGLVGLTVSCAKDDETADKTDTSTSTASSNYFKAKINGSDFAVNLLNTSVTDDMLTFIAGSSTTERAVGIFMPATIAPGSYPTSQFGVYRITYTSAATQNNTYSAKDNGTITITSNNTTSKIIKGTFAADATHTSAGAADDTVKITAGEFIIVY